MGLGGEMDSVPVTRVLNRKFRKNLDSIFSCVRDLPITVGKLFVSICLFYFVCSISLIYNSLIRMNKNGYT